MNGGAGIDAGSWQDAPSGVSANLATGRMGDSIGDEDTFTQVENLIGSRFTDFLTGDRGANELFGGSGNDTLDGSAGQNVLKGGSGVDTVDYAGQSSAVEVLLFEGRMTGQDRVDLLTEIEAVRGSNFADGLFGDAFGNQLFVNGGADIDGGEGNDVLSGGAGADAFDFDAQAQSKFRFPIDSGFDRITDFERSRGNLIDLRTHKEATDFADLRVEASEFGAYTHLRLGEDTIVLQDVALNGLSVEKFLF